MTRRLTPDPDVVARRLDDTVLLVHLDTNRMLTLNRTGSRIWELLHEGHNVDDIEARLVADYEVGAAEVHDQVALLVTDLISERLVIETDEGPT